MSVSVSPKNAPKGRPPSLPRQCHANHPRTPFVAGLPATKGSTKTTVGQRVAIRFGRCLQLLYIFALTPLAGLSVDIGSEPGSENNCDGPQSRNPQFAPPHATRVPATPPRSPATGSRSTPSMHWCVSLPLPRFHPRYDVASAIPQSGAIELTYFAKTPACSMLMR